MINYTSTDPAHNAALLSRSIIIVAEFLSPIVANIRSLSNCSAGTSTYE